MQKKKKKRSPVCHDAGCDHFQEMRVCTVFTDTWLSRPWVMWKLLSVDYLPRKSNSQLHIGIFVFCKSIRNLMLVLFLFCPHRSRYKGAAWCESPWENHDGGEACPGPKVMPRTRLQQVEGRHSHVRSLPTGWRFHPPEKP